MHYPIAHLRMSLYATVSQRTEEAGACSGLEPWRQGVSDALALGPTKLPVAQESGMNGKQVLEKSWDYEACVTYAWISCSIGFTSVAGTTLPAHQLSVTSASGSGYSTEVCAVVESTPTMGTKHGSIKLGYKCI